MISHPAVLHVYRCDVAGCGYATKPATARALALAFRVHRHRHRAGLVPIPWHPR